LGYSAKHAAGSHTHAQAIDEDPAGERKHLYLFSHGYDYFIRFFRGQYDKRMRTGRRLAQHCIHSVSPATNNKPTVMYVDNKIPTTSTAIWQRQAGMTNLLRMSATLAANVDKVMNHASGTPMGNQLSQGVPKTIYATGNYPKN